MALTSGQQFAYGSLYAQGAATLVNAFGSFGITRHNNAIAQSQANIARLNAQMMEWQAQGRLRSNEKDQVRLTMQAGQVKGSQRAALAANGIAVGEGSAAELQATTDIIKEIDSNQLTENAHRDAWGMRMQGANYEGQALMAEALLDRTTVASLDYFDPLQSQSYVAHQHTAIDLQLHNSDVQVSLGTA